MGGGGGGGGSLLLTDRFSTTVSYFFVLFSGNFCAGGQGCDGGEPSRIGGPRNPPTRETPVLEMITLNTPILIFVPLAFHCNPVMKTQISVILGLCLYQLTV